MRARIAQPLRRPISSPRHRSLVGAPRRPRRLSRSFALAAVALAMGASAASANSSASAPALASDVLERAQAIRAEVNARYQRLAGRKLVATAATSTAGVSRFVLVTDWLKPRMLEVENGIHFDTCSARARCPYPARGAAWSEDAFLPRRQALELALRTLVETAAGLVVVSLPTAQPVWAVFGRDDLLANIDAPAVLDRLASNPAVVDRPLRELVDRLTRFRLFAPLAVVADDAIIAVRLGTRDR